MWMNAPFFSTESPQNRRLHIMLSNIATQLIEILEIKTQNVG